MSELNLNELIALLTAGRIVAGWVRRVDLLVRPRYKKEDYWALRFDLTGALKEQLEAIGCGIPYRQRDVHFLQFPS